MINIFNDFGGLPVTFIRYNPDGYTDSKGVKHVSNSLQAQRHKRLLTLIENLKHNPPAKVELNVIYLYYDEDTGQNIIQTIDYETFKLVEKKLDNKVETSPSECTDNVQTQ